MILIVMLSVTTVAFPSANPPWPATYNVTQSLIQMSVNASGYRTTPNLDAQFGITSYDWSNAKAVWAMETPMTCEEDLAKQAKITKDQGATHVFVYRNLVKALPWFSTVREKLLDPAYSGFFLSFDTSKDASSYHVDPCAAENATKCSFLYHDQEQTPQVPTTSNPNPDGKCPSTGCDCGPNLPCGEYVFDHSNGTMLREWLINEVILNAETSVGNGIIDGMFIDDFWCSDLLCQEHNNTLPICPCNDPTQGPSEMDSHAVQDMGLTDEKVREITINWMETMTYAKEALLQQKAYTWSLIEGQAYANAYPFTIDTSSMNATAQTDYCLKAMREACRPTSLWQHKPRLFGFAQNGTALTQVPVDIAAFLLIRGPYTYAGWGEWGMEWPIDNVPLPSEFFVDYGEPMAPCHELESTDGAKTGVFKREWTKAMIEFDCNSFTPSIQFSNGASGMAIGSQAFPYSFLRGGRVQLT